jgi:hypothetical protein
MIPKSFECFFNTIPGRCLSIEKPRLCRLQTMVAILIEQKELFSPNSPVQESHNSESGMLTKSYHGRVLIRLGRRIHIGWIPVKPKTTGVGKFRHRFARTCTLLLRAGGALQPHPRDSLLSDEASATPSAAECFSFQLIVAFVGPTFTVARHAVQANKSHTDLRSTI